MQQEEIRCSNCNRLLFKMMPDALVGQLSIKCPRCKQMNSLRPLSPHPERQEREGKEALCGSSSPPKT
ncbi:MAG: Com family DNA-binding transcriptional regulator [Chloroflexota bacterium]